MAHSRRDPWDLSELNHGWFLPDPAGGWVFQQKQSACCCLLCAPLCDFLEELPGLCPPHHQEDLPADVVRVVLQQAPVTAINALDQDERFEVIQVPAGGAAAVSLKLWLLLVMLATAFLATVLTR